MSARSDSPILPSFDRKYSEKTLSCITKTHSPKHGATFLHKPSLTSSPESYSPVTSDNQYTFLRDPSIASQSSSSTSSPPSPTTPDQKFPSCLSLPNLGSESESPVDDEDYTTGWNIASAADGCAQEAVVAELPLITEAEFPYYPQAAEVSHVDQWEKDVEERGMMLLRRKSGLKESAFGKWWKKIGKTLGMKTKQ